MAESYIPSREAELVTFSQNYNNRIQVDPVSFGLNAAQASDFENKQTAFVSAYNLAKDPITRTPVAVEAKDDAKAALISVIRELTAIVQATPSVTNAQRIELGVTVRDNEPTPVPAPKFAPALQITGVMGRTVSVSVHDSQDPENRRKPAGSIGANMYAYVGATPPDELDDWSFKGMLTRSTGEIVFPGSVTVGSQVWITAAWTNAKGEMGPTSQAMTTSVTAGMNQAA